MEKNSTSFIFALVLGALIVLLILAFNKAIERYKRHLRFRHGLDGEIRAKKFMEEKGYKVLEYQPEVNYRIFVNSEPHNIKIKPDYIVSKMGKVYVAEVKTGGYAPSIYSKDTRRQLLEYYISTEYDGVLLVDMEDKNIYNIEIESGRFGNKNSGKLFFVGGLICFLISALLFIIK